MEYFVAMATRKILNSFVVLGAMNFILGMEILWGSGGSVTYFVTMVTQLPWKEKKY